MKHIHLKELFKEDAKPRPIHLAQPYPIVEIWFVPFPMEISRVRFDCPSPNKRGGNSSGVDPVMRIGRALPFYLKFVAKDEEQIIIDSSKDSDDGAYLKIWVRKLKDD